MKWINVALVAALLGASGASFAHGDETHAAQNHVPIKNEQKPWGIAGDAKDIKRTIQIEMRDTMRFSPDIINVRQGETIKLVMTNTGKVLHELVMGTKQDLDKHAALMAKFPTMEHSEPYTVHVAPGKTGEILWTFNQPGDFDFACLIGGHYQSGMVGKIRVAAR